MKVLKNNFYILKLIFQASPKVVIVSTLSQLFYSLNEVIYSLIMFPLIVEALQGEKTFTDVMIFLLIFSAFSIVSYVLTGYEEAVQFKEIMVVQHYLMRKIYNKAINVDLYCYENPEFYDNYTKANAEILNRFTDILYNIIWMISIIVSAIISISVIIAYEPIVFIIVIIPVILERFIDSKYTRAKFDRNKETTPYSRQMDYVDRMVYLQDYAKDLRLSSIFGPVMKNFHNALDMTVKIMKQYGFKIGFCRFLKTILMGFVVFFAVQALTIYKFLKFGAYGLAGITRLINASSELTGILGSLSWASASFYENGMFIENLKVFLEYEPKIVEDPEGKIPENKEHKISIKDVSFCYEGAKNSVLEHISMEIQPRQKIALVGHNGAGKSTLVKLLMRLYDVSEGEITLDGVNIKEFETEKYRKEFGAAFQDFQIFAATLGENVVMNFNSAEDEDKIIDALKHSGFEDKLLDLPLGIKTPLTKEFYKEGTNLSGGENQKVAISRVFYKPCRYAILDEPSSALDPISEYNLNQNMITIAENKTVIFISHRLSTTCMADKIYMLEKGEIIEQGSHKELMELNGKYAEMFNKQAEKYRNAV